jgi:hypothetical protein
MAGVAMGRPRKNKAQDKSAPPIKTIAVRATMDWVTWVERGADHCRTDVSKLIDAALADYLKARGFPELPPKRTP